MSKSISLTVEIAFIEHHTWTVNMLILSDADIVTTVLIIFEQVGSLIS
jgi:hypothetical protein